MKKILLMMLAAAALLSVSCQKGLVEGGNSPDDTAKVSVDLSFPTIQTRAYSDGTTAKQLQYAVYVKGNDGLKLLDGFTKTEQINLKKEVSFQLVTGHTYGFVFWAADASAPYTVAFGEKGATMTVNGELYANDEKLDAFYAYKEIEVKGDVGMQVQLRRPFAQINVGTDDYDPAAAAGYVPTVSHIQLSSVYTTLDLVSGNVGGEVQDQDFAYAPLPALTEKFPVEGAECNYMAMVYALVGADESVVEVSFDCKDKDDDSGEVRAKYTVGSVPVQRNHRTNIYGQLLTSNAKVIVEIVPEYEEPNYEVIAVADGVVYDEATDTFTVSSPAGLQWVAAQVNGNGGNSYVKTAKYVYGGAMVAFEKQTIELAGDLDMADVDWTPIGYETKKTSSTIGASIYAFAGTFDGKNHIISNLTVTTEKNDNAGLFGATNYATIKNLTLEDVNIDGHYKTAAFVADAWCTTIDNCHVKGGTVTSTPWEIKPNVYDDANNVGGIVGYLCGQPDAAAVTNCTVDGVAITAFRKIGGIVGVASFRKDDYGEPSATITGCTVSNTTITADMTEMRYDGYATRQPAIDEIVGEAQEGTKMDNNTSSDNVSLETKKANIVGASDAAAAIKAGGNVFLTESVSSQNGYTMTKDANINLNNNSLSAKSNGNYGDNIVIGNGATVTISNGEIKPADDASVDNSSATIIVKTAYESHLTLNNVKATGIHPVYLNSANENSTVTINGGEYYTTMPLEGVDSDSMAPAVYVAKGSTGSTIGGKVTINGGTFGSKGVVNNFLLNVEDVLRKQEGKEPRNFIEVFGGKFYNFDPSNNKAEGPGTNFVADGYTVVSYADGEDTIYEVVAE